MISGGTMARHRSESRAWSSARAGDGLADAARGRLATAVTELRRLTQDQLFQALNQLADVDDAGGDYQVGAGRVRRLQGWTAEQSRVAAELEAAVRCCRLIEEELREQFDMLLASPDGTVSDYGNGKPVVTIHHRSLAGWLKAIFQRSHSAYEPRHSEAVTASRQARKRSPVTSLARSLSAPSRSEADIAALILGPLELDVAGRRVLRWNSLKARAVFQYLLVNHGRPVRRDVLMELQWPNHTPTSARNNLNVALYSLRNTLEGPWQGLQPVLHQDGCYFLNPDLRWWTDRDQFLSVLRQAQLSRGSSHPGEAICEYEKAVELYRGPLFEDDLTGDWYLPEQRHLNDLYLEALEGLGEIYFDLGELTSAEWFGKQALTSDPCCEPAHRLLMRCYAREQRQQLVCRQYRLCVDALRDELAVAPGAETLRLFHELTSTSH
jgi:DNA-binding SARP family transcriptional activator